MATNINTILGWFTTGKKPTQVQFWTSWQSFWHKDEIIPQSSINNLTNTLNAKVEKSEFEAHKADEVAHATLFGVKEDKAKKGVPNGYAPLNSFTKLANQYLDIVNDLVTGGSTSILSAEQGKLLQNKINDINTLLTSDNVNLDTVQKIVDTIETIQASLSTILVNDLTSGGTTKALTAEMGKLLQINKVDKVTGERLINANEIIKVFNQSGTNTGDETTTTIKDKLGITKLSGVNTGDQDLTGLEVKSNKNTANGYAGLGSDGKLISSQLPSITICDTFISSSQTGMLALTAETGDITVRTDLNKSFILKGTDPKVLADWQELLTPTSAVTTVFGRNGAITAQTGDYSADQINETATRKFQTTTQNAHNDATSPIQGQLDNKQTTLISGATIKTINGVSLLGSGDVAISSGTTITGSSNKLTKFNSTRNNIINSNITDTGTLVTIDTPTTIDSGTIDNSGLRLSKLPTPTVFSEITVATGLNHAVSIVLDNSNTFAYEAETGGTVRKINISTGVSSLLPLTELTIPDGTYGNTICIDPAGNLYVTSNAKVFKIDTSNVVTLLATITDYTTGIIYGIDGNLYTISVWGQLTKITLAGAVTIISNTSSPTATAMCQDTQGNFYIGSTNYPEIYKIAVGTSSPVLFYTNSTGVMSLILKNNNTLWIVNNGSSNATVDPLDLVTKTVTPNGIRLSVISPRDGFIDSSGTLYAIGSKMDSSGYILENIVAPNAKVLKTDQNGLVVKTTYLEDVQYVKADTYGNPINAPTVSLSNVDNTSDINKPISKAMQIALDQRIKEVVERNGLVINGLLTNKNNDYFPELAFNETDYNVGFGSLDSQLSVSNTIVGSQRIPVEPSKKYKFTVSVKQRGTNTIAEFYAGLVPFDEDGLAIPSFTYNAQPNTFTTLAKTLVDGATTIQLTSSLNWNNSPTAPSYQRGIIFWNYANSRGRKWKAGEYSRNVHFDLYNAGAIVENVITLKKPWEGGVIEAGTELSNSTFGQPYIYLGAAGVVPTKTWQTYKGITSGSSPLFSSVNYGFLPISATTVSALFIPNSLNSINSKHSVCGISLVDLG